MHKVVTCQLWDRQDLDEPGILETPDGKRRQLAPAWEPDIQADARWRYQ